MKLHFTLEEQIQWLDRKGFVTKYQELPFDRYDDRNRRIGTELRTVPLFSDFNVCDEYREYVRRIEYKFYTEFKSFLLSL